MTTNSADLMTATECPTCGQGVGYWMPARKGSGHVLIATRCGHEHQWDPQEPREPVLTLTDFLLARIAEEEAARWDTHRIDCNTIEASRQPYTGAAVSAQCDCGIPARVLAECEAKRRIVASCDVYLDYQPQATHVEALARTVLHSLALPYADHPEYRAEWKP